MGISATVTEIVFSQTRSPPSIRAEVTVGGRRPVEAVVSVNNTGVVVAKTPIAVTKAKFATEVAKSSAAVNTDALEETTEEEQEPAPEVAKEKKSLFAGN